jgi:hypothetical protein
VAHPRGLLAVVLVLRLRRQRGRRLPLLPRAGVAQPELLQGHLLLLLLPLDPLRQRPRQPGRCRRRRHRRRRVLRLLHLLQRMLQPVQLRGRGPAWQRAGAGAGAGGDPGPLQLHALARREGDHVPRDGLPAAATAAGGRRK